MLLLLGATTPRGNMSGNNDAQLTSISKEPQPGVKYLDMGRFGDDSGIMLSVGYLNEIVAHGHANAGP